MRWLSAVRFIVQAGRAAPDLGLIPQGAGAASSQPTQRSLAPSPTDGWTERTGGGSGGTEGRTALSRRRGAPFWGAEPRVPAAALHRAPPRTAPAPPRPRGHRLPAHRPAPWRPRRDPRGGSGRGCAHGKGCSGLASGRARGPAAPWAAWGVAALWPGSPRGLPYPELPAAGVVVLEVSLQRCRTVSISPLQWLKPTTIEATREGRKSQTREQFLCLSVSPKLQWVDSSSSRSCMYFLTLIAQKEAISFINSSRSSYLSFLVLRKHLGPCFYTILSHLLCDNYAKFSPFDLEVHGLLCLPRSTSD